MFVIPLGWRCLACREGIGCFLYQPHLLSFFFFCPFSETATSSSISQIKRIFGLYRSCENLAAASAADAGDQPRRKSKGSVSELIARFESSSRSSTPERSITPDRSHAGGSRPFVEPPSRPSPIFGTESVRPTGAIPKKQAFVPAAAAVLKSESKSPSGPVRSSSSSRLSSAAAVAAAQAASSGSLDRTANDGVHNTANSDPGGSRSVAEEEEDEDGEARRRAELKGLKEFAQKYLSDNSARNGHQASSPPPPLRGPARLDNQQPLLRPDQPPVEARPPAPASSEAEAAAVAGDGEEVRGAEALVVVDSDTEDLDSMPPTIRDVRLGHHTTTIIISHIIGMIFN